MQLPLTPLIDVMFQLLLFFVLTNSLSQMEGRMDGSVMQGPTGAAVAGRDILKPLILSVRTAADGAAYRIGESADAIGDPQELYLKLVGYREALGSDDIPVVIQARWDVPWRDVVQAFNQALRAKFRNVGIRPSSS
jgi:biopolymer transport protein ExbD